MRTHIRRWLAIIAVVAGISVGAATLPASAATPDPSTTSSSTSGPASSGHVRPAADWWL